MTGPSPSQPQQSQSARSLPWQTWLNECREHFGPPTRTFTRETERRLLVNPPWITKLHFADKLARLVQNSTLRNLFRNGHVVWGYVLQANDELFETPPSIESYTFDRPGELLFSPDSTGKVTPHVLSAVGQRLVGLRDATQLDTELQGWADYFRSETTRVIGKPVPARMCPPGMCYASTTLFRRSYLPDGVLRKSIVPIVVAPHPPYFVMTLPHEYWPNSFLAWWKGAGQQS